MLKKLSSPFESRNRGSSTCSPSKSSFSMSTISNSSNTTKFALGLVVLLLVLALLYNFNPRFKTYADGLRSSWSSGSSSQMSSKSVPNMIKDLGIIFILDPSSEPCQQMVDVFNKEGTSQHYEYIDISVPEQKEFAEKIGALERGVPNFISKKLGVGFVGPRNSSEEIINTLVAVEQNMKSKAAKESYENTEGQDLQGIQELRNRLQQLNIIMFKMNGCGHCTHVLDELKSLGLTDSLEVVEVSGDSARKYISDFNLPANGGVPFFYSRTTGKLLRGSRPVVKIVEEIA
jgi:glutaredoxin